MESVEDGFEIAVNDLMIANVTSPSSIFSLVSKVFKIGFLSKLFRRTPKNISRNLKPSALGLPEIDPKSGIIPGTHNPHIGPAIRFEPGIAPDYVPGF